MEKIYGINENGDVLFLNESEKFSERVEKSEKDFSDENIIYYFRESSIDEMLKILKSNNVDKYESVEDNLDLFGFSNNEIIKYLGKYESFDDYEEEIKDDAVLQDILWYFNAESARNLYKQLDFINYEFNFNNKKDVYKVIEVKIGSTMEVEVFNNITKKKEKINIKDFINKYQENKEMFDISGDLSDDFLKSNDLYSFNYYRDFNKESIKDFSTFLEETKDLKDLETKKFKMYLSDKCYNIETNFKLLRVFQARDMITSYTILDSYKKSLSSEEELELKTLIIDDKEEIIKIKFKNKIQKSLFLLNSRRIFKNKIYETDLKNDYKIKNKTNLYFLINTLEDFIFQTKDMKQENQNFFKQLDNMNESFENDNVSNNMYINNVNGFIKRNNGKAVIADSTSQKEEAVTVYLNNNSETNLIVGKPESLEKYQSLNLKNASYIKNTIFSSRKNIIEIKTKDNSVIKYDNKTKNLYLNEVIIDTNVLELNVEKNGEINYLIKNRQNEDEKKELKNTTHYFITEETQKIIEENKNIESFVLSDAEKIKDSKSLMFYSLLGVVENINVKNKLFVSSNPIYNTVKEIEPLLTILDNDLLDEIKNVINDYSARDLKNKKDEFLLKILKKYILKREKDELKLMTSEEQSNTIKDTKYINKRVGILKEETEYYDNIKKGIDKYLKDILKFSLKRVENKELSINNSSYVKDLDYYMTDYEKFQVLQGKKLSIEQKYQISGIFYDANIKENNIEISSSRRNSYSKEFINNNMDKLTQEQKDKITFIKTSPAYDLNLRLYEKVLKTPFNKIKEYDIENNELIDGVRIKKRHLNQIELEKNDSPLNNKLKNILLPETHLFYNNDIEKSLNKIKKYKNDIVYYIDYFLKTNYEDITNSSSKNVVNVNNYLSSFNIKTSFNSINERNDYLNDLKKEINNLHNRLVLILEGEKVSFYKLLEKQLNLKVIHKKMAELKTKNTIRVVNELTEKNENVMVCSMYNGVIDELKEKYPEAVVVKNKSDLENLNLDEGKSNIVLSTFNKLGENVQNKFKGSLVYNDLPWNKATSEKVENSLEQKDINVYINSMEGNILDNLFVSRNNAKTENLKKLFNTGEKYEQLSDNDFKELMIKNIFKDYMLNIDEKFFQDIKNSYEHEVEIYKTISLLNQDLSF